MLAQDTILKQLAACKIASNRYQEAEDFLIQNISSDCTDLRYYLGLSYAAQGKFEDSLRELLSALKSDPSCDKAKHLAFKLLLNQARQKIIDKDIDSISSVLSLAVELAPDTHDAQKELSYFKNALPMSYMKAGKRDEAARIWEDELKKHPMDGGVIHNLALLYYWWALTEEPKTADEPGTDCDIAAIWKKSITYWVILLNVSDFWKKWKDDKEDTWKSKINSDDLKEFRESFLEERFIKVFNDYIDRYKQIGRDQDSLRHEEYLINVLLERESARCWKDILDTINTWASARDIKLDNGIKRYELIRAIQKAEGKEQCFGAVKECTKTLEECVWSTSCESDRNRELFLNIPAGCQFFEDFAMCPEVDKLIELLHKEHPDSESIGKLRIYFHPSGVGKALILVEQKKKPHLAINKLFAIAAINSSYENSHEYRYVYALSLLERGRLLSKEGNISKALDDWASASEQIAEPIKFVDNNPILRNFFIYLSADIDNAVIKNCEKEANRLNGADKIDDAISILHNGIKIVAHPNNKTLSNHLAIFYCDRGDKKLSEKRFPDARKDFEEALKYDREYKRAKTSIGTTYNNEGVSKSSPDESIPLFEKATQYDPDSNVVKENLAGAYNGKAISILNSLNPDSNQEEYDRAINLLKKAIKILNPSLEESSINHIVEFDSEKEIEEITKDMGDSLYKTVLKNLSAASNNRRYNVAGNYNKRAVNILNTLTQYSSYSKCDEAIDLLKKALKILNPSFDMSLIDRFAYTEEWQFKNMTSNLPDDLYRTVLHNLWVACRSRKNLRGY